MVTKGLIVTEERKMEEIWVGLCRKPVSFSQESAGVGLRILGVYINHLSDTGSWEVEFSRWYSWVFPVALGGGLALISHKPRCLKKPGPTVLSGDLWLLSVWVG